ncbi:ferrochelatase [Noviluteimonas dokdonensis]|nr:ferrochelatase [Lysobacter dokdonensis]
MPGIEHPRAADAAVVLINLGTPDAPTPGAVRRYLSQFLMDPRVVQIPRWLWWPLLHWVILPLRSKRVAHKYAEIWMDAGSPLAVHTRRLAAAVAQRMPGTRVVHAMRYGQPAVHEVLDGLRREGIARVVVLPLYPQYSTTTTASVDDAVRASGALPARVIGDYHLDAAWVQAVADSIRAHWDVNGRGERLVFSFHGLPQRVVDNGDPYADQCKASVAGIVGDLGLHDEDYVLTFQSRFGKERWLEPATITTLEAMARAGTRRVDVVCPGFAVDCLETLEEIAQQNADAFRAAGGQAMQYIPCLNDTPAHADALAALCDKALRA